MPNDCSWLELGRDIIDIKEATMNNKAIKIQTFLKKKLFHPDNTSINCGTMSNRSPTNP